MLLSARHDADFKLNPCRGAIQPVPFCYHWCCFGRLWKRSPSSMLEALLTWSHLIFTSMLWGRYYYPHFTKGEVGTQRDSSKVAQLTNGTNWVQPYTLSAPPHRVPALPPALKLQMGFSPSAGWKLEMGACGEGELQGFSAEDRNLLAFCPQTLSLFFLAGEKHDIIGDSVLYTHTHTPRRGLTIYRGSTTYQRCWQRTYQTSFEAKYLSEQELLNLSTWTRD